MSPPCAVLESSLIALVCVYICRRGSARGVAQARREGRAYVQLCCSIDIVLKRSSHLPWSDYLTRISCTLLFPEDPMFFGRAYGATQPKPVFSADDPEAAVEAEEAAIAAEIAARAANVRKA